MAQSAKERDRARLWHPYSASVAQEPLYLVEGADGFRLQLASGSTRYSAIDAMASWWCTIHGYRHPELDAAAHAQLDRFSHVMFGGLTHDPAIRLAESLTELTGFERSFLVDSGSVAVEVALKFARQVQQSRGEHQRRSFISLRGAYHGDTWGAMGVCDPIGSMHAQHGAALDAHAFLPRPPAFDAGPEEVARWQAEARALVVSLAEKTVGIIVEPILQGAGGMWAWSPACLSYLRQLADDFGLLLIADEVATGFGRTGKLFACDWAGIRPDILAVGKALTGGYLSQAAMLTTDELASSLAGPLMHGPTFMANPLASSISCASLGLIASGTWRDQVAGIEAVLKAELAGIDSQPGVASVRVLGAAAAIELSQPVDVRLATQVALDHGVWLRPFGRLVYAMPAYIVTPEAAHSIGSALVAAALASAEATA